MPTFLHYWVSESRKFHLVCGFQEHVLSYSDISTSIVFSIHVDDPHAKFCVNWLRVTTERMSWSKNLEAKIELGNSIKKIG